MDRNLRPAISRCQPPRLAMDQLTELVAKIQALCADSGLCEGVSQAELGQLAHRCRLQVDPNAERQGIAHRLEEANLDAGLMQAEREAQPADAASDDYDPVLFHRAATRGSWTLLKVSNSTLRSSPSTFSTLRM